MIDAQMTAGEKRAAFRQKLAQGGLMRFPGAFAPLVAMMVEQAGFDGVYISGAGIAAEKGLPDIGLTSQEEVVAEALQSEAEFAAFRSAIDLPLLANMTEFGNSPLLSAPQLEALGFNIVIYPMTAMRLALKAIDDGLTALKRNDDQAALVEHMWTRSRLYEALGYAAYNQFDQDIYNFDLEAKD